MYQRSSQSKISPMDGSSISPMKLVMFLKAAKEDYERRGKEDEAFVLEMLEDHFREGKPAVYTSKIFGF